MTYSIEDVQKLADNERLLAKKFLAQALGQTGYLNDELPISQCIDKIINTAILETTLTQMKARGEVR